MRRSNRNTATPIATDLDQRALREQIRAEFYGTEEHLLARRALLDEPILAERFEAYVKAGGPAIRLDTIPKYRRITLIEQRLDEFNMKRSLHPCDACGSYALRHPSYGSPVMDPSAMPPGHELRTVQMDDEHATKRTLLLCGNCKDEHAHRSDGILGLARAIFAATAGYRGNSYPNRAWLYFEQPQHHTDHPTPWGHVNRAAVIGHAKQMLRDGEWIPSRLVTNSGQAALLTEHLPGVTAHIWAVSSIPTIDLPSLSSTVASRDEDDIFTALTQAKTTRRQAIRTAEQALNAQTAKFIAAHPVPATGYEDKDAADYDDLLKAHRKALLKIDNEFYAAQPANLIGAGQVWKP